MCPYLKEIGRFVKMGTELVAVIDAGTTGLRTMIFDIKGEELGRDYVEYESFFPKPAWVEQNADDWWQAVCQTAKNVLKRGKINPSDIIGISVTNQRETVVPVNERGKPLRRALVWQDRRTIPECDEIRKAVGEEEIYRITGLTIDPYFSASKILFIKIHEPAIFSQAHKFLLVHDFIEMKLTDQFITDWSNASRTMLFDIEKHSWSKAICEKLEIPLEKMPTPVPSGEIIGSITKTAAQETGFIEGTPVISGAGDQQAGALGLGVVNPGRLSCTTGTGTFLIGYLKNPLWDAKRRALCSCHAVPEAWVMEASIFTTGSLYRWFRDQMSVYEKMRAAEEGKDPYELLDAQAAEAPTGANGVVILPHFAGAGAPHWNPYSRGLIAGLALGHTRKDIIRAIMEGICFEIKKNIVVMQELGISTNQVRVTGGMTRNMLFNQIQADIYGIDVLLSATEEATALGTAMLVLKGANIYKTYQEVADNLLTISEKLPPNPKNEERYHKIFHLSKKIYEVLNQSNIFRELSDL